MKSFTLFIDYAVLEYVVKLSRREGTAVREQMLRIRDYPGNYADFVEIDDFGREYQNNIFRGHAIKYWIDDADRQVKIMDVRPSDRG